MSSIILTLGGQNLILLSFMLSIMLGYIQQQRWRTLQNVCKTDRHSEEVNHDETLEDLASIVRKKKHRLTMGLHKPKDKEWLLLDDNYLAEHKIKKRLMEQKRPSILGCSPGSEAACGEALECVVKYLTTTYPHSFERMKDSASGDYVQNVKAGERFEIPQSHEEGMPLEIVARLAAEDFNVLMKGSDGQHILAASATCYPVGWSIDDRLGWPIHKMHDAVPLWHERLGHPVERFLSQVTTENILERSPYFVQIANLGGDLGDVLCQLTPLEFSTKPTNPEHIIIRSERQTFRRLPKTDCVLFAVKTKLRPLTDLNGAELQTFVDDVSSWSEDMAVYKGRHCWGECAINYAKSVLPK